jgi:predicted lipoprotein with Yx(FWY)xxD motif
MVDEPAPTDVAASSQPQDTDVSASVATTVPATAVTAGTVGPVAPGTAASACTALNPCGPTPAVGTLYAGAIGEILVDQNRMTLYTLSADQPGSSTCSSACAEAWPPAVIDAASAAAIRTQAPPGIAEIRTMDRDGGSVQLTWAGKPLYRFAEDAVPGDLNGNGVDAFGGTWSLVVVAAETSS